jgi:uncharacterized protein YoaH (UPF0181 family)
MARVTVNLDAPVLGRLKRRQHKERKSLSELINQLLAQVLAETEAASGVARPLRWTSKAMRARRDLEDKDITLPDVV